MSYVEDLAGHDGPHCGDDETALLEKLDDYGRAAFALGLAVGPLMSPAVFGRTLTKRGTVGCVAQDALGAPSLSR